MAQCTRRTRLLLEAPGSFAVVGELCGQYFDSDFAAQRVIPGAVYLTHRSRADSLQEVVAP